MRKYRFQRTGTTRTGAPTATHTGALPDSASFVDVLEVNAHVYADRGWRKLIPVGTTSERPSATEALNPHLAYFLDTTLNKVIVFDGASQWTDPLTGNPV